MLPADLSAAHIRLARTLALNAIRSLPEAIRSRLADDVLSDAMLGLVKAARDFDEERGVPFGAYATRRIRGEIGDGYRRHGLSGRAERGSRTGLPRLLLDDGAAPDGEPASRPVERPPIDYGNADPGESMLNRHAEQQTAQQLAMWLAPRLPHAQWRTFMGLVDGKSQREIADQAGITESAVSFNVRFIRQAVARSPIRPPWREGTLE